MHNEYQNGLPYSFVCYMFVLFVLADRMRSEFGFGDSDVNNIDRVIEALRDLVSGPEYGY